MRIDDDWLRENDACRRQRARFRALWPNGCKLTRHNLRRAANNGLNVQWLRPRALDPSYDAFFESTLQAWCELPRNIRNGDSWPRSPKWRAYQLVCADVLADLMGV